MSAPGQEEKDRWRELHELLGLPPDSAGAAPSPPPPPPRPVEPPRPIMHETPRTRQAWTPEEPDAELAGEPASPGVENQSMAEAEAFPPEVEEIPPPLDDESAPLPRRVDSDEEGDRPRRGRRRGRRGRRSRGRRDEAAPAVSPDDDTEVEPQAGEAPPAGRPDHDRRRRDDERRGRRRDEESADELAPADDEVAPRAAAKPEDEDDDEPIETFADWNVPSWQEIIASLYRPER